MAYTFIWDEDKRLANILKHDIDFEDVAPFFEGAVFNELDMRGDYGEDRWRALGLLNEIIIVVVYTEMDTDTIRLISARRALKHEQKRYNRFLRDELGATEEHDRRRN